MKKSIVIALLFFYSSLYADDYKWNLINALIRNDYPLIENIIIRNINTIPADEKSLIKNFTLTYSYGDTAVRVLTLLQRYNIHPAAFDLYTAINRNQSDNVIQFILNRGVTANGEILLLAMEKQRFDLAEYFILAGVDANYSYPLSNSYADGMTCLLYASKYNNFELVRLLADRGANINAKNRDGATALSIAQNNGNTQISEFLIERGANQTVFTPPVSTQPQTSGISGYFDNQEMQFQPGNYRLSGSDRDITFAGTSNYGTISYIRNSRVYSGTYHAANENITLMMDGRMFIYKIDSGVSFSGHGEIWLKR